MATAILAALSNLIILVVEKVGYSGIFILMALQSVNVPIPSEIIMPFSGFLAERGVFNLGLVVLVGALGNLVGSLISYQLAAHLVKDGTRAKHPFLKILISERKLEQSKEWFKKRGRFSVFIARLVPVVSTFISFSAGIAKMRLLTFSVLTFFGALIWSAFLAWLGFALGENWRILEIYFRKFDYIILIILLLLAGLWLWHNFKNNKNVQGEKLL